MAEHNLTQINGKLALCSHCGPVKIYVWDGAGRTVRRCSNANREAVSNRRQRNIRRNKEVAEEHKVRCRRCGFEDGRALELHRLPKDMSADDYALSPARFDQELVLSTVLCANCHKIVHQENT